MILIYIQDGKGSKGTSSNSKAIGSPGSNKKDDTSTTNKSKDSLPVEKVIVHPLVLLSVVDHFNRMGKIGNQKRVVGCLLGAMKGNGILDVTSSFAGKFLVSFSRKIQIDCQ